MGKIILASSSPRRKELLALADLDFEVKVQPVDETMDAALSIADAILSIAHKKAKAVLPFVENDDIVIAADTVVVFQSQIIGKPVNEADAIQILTQLQDAMHTVITAVSMVLGQKEISFVDKTEVYFNALSTQQIEYYVSTYKPYDKAGAYAIQEWIGAVAVNRINGDYFNVMGLPINRVLQAINTIKIP